MGRMRYGRGRRTHDRTIYTSRSTQSPRRSTHPKRAIANHLRPSDNRLHDVVHIRLIGKGSGSSADFHQPREDRSADLVRFPPLARHAPFYELDLPWVKGAGEFWHESTVESIHCTTCGGGGSVEHSREVICGLEDTGDGSWGLLGPRVCGRVQMENFGDARHVFVKNQLRHLGRKCFDGRREGLTPPHGSNGRVTWGLNVSPPSSSQRESTYGQRCVRVSSSIGCSPPGSSSQSNNLQSPLIWPVRPRAAGGSGPASRWHLLSSPPPLLGGSLRKYLRPRLDGYR